MRVQSVRVGKDMLHDLIVFKVALFSSIDYLVVDDPEDCGEK